MPESTKNDRLKQWLNSPYQPETGIGIDKQERIAKAAEYGAYKLFQIRESLDELINVTADLATQLQLMRSNKG